MIYGNSPVMSRYPHWCAKMPRERLYPEKPLSRRIPYSHTPMKREAVESEWKYFAEQMVRGEAFQQFSNRFQSTIEGHRTRRIKLIGRRCKPEIVTTFLGYEIIASNKRILCPDMVTARYLRMFAEVGLKEVVIPYDVTKTQECLPDLEEAFGELKTIVDFFTDQIVGRSEQAKFLNSVHRSIRAAVIKMSPAREAPRGQLG